MTHLKNWLLRRLCPDEAAIRELIAQFLPGHELCNGRQQQIVLRPFNPAELKQKFKEQSVADFHISNNPPRGRKRKKEGEEKE